MNPNIQLPWPDWELAGVLGAGGFGAVYEIRRDVFGTTERAAVKILSIPRDQDEITQFRAEGYDEASISAHYRDTLKEIVQEYSLMLEVKGNTNVVCCDDLRYVPQPGGIGWNIFIKMELLTPLTKHMTHDYRESDVIRLGMDLCSALTLCRHKGIVHRDIKPANIFISRTGDYKLGDFGIAKFSDKTTQGTRIGTYEFMAPEVYNNQPYGATADIYCLGMVLYWMMNQRRTPFLPLPPQIPTSSQKEQAGAMRYSGHPLPEPCHGSPALKRIVMKACAFIPEARYASSEEMARDLAQLLQAPAPAATPIPNPQAEAPTEEWDNIFKAAPPADGWQPPQWAPQSAPQQTVPQQPPIPMSQTMPRPTVPPMPPKSAPAGKKPPVWLFILIGVVAVILVIGLIVGIALGGSGGSKDGWVTENGSKYYYINGRTVSGWHEIDGTMRYFNSDGSLPKKTPEKPVVNLYLGEGSVEFSTNSGNPWSTSYLLLEEPVYDCIKLDYSLSVSSSSGYSSDGEWALYILTTDGRWVNAGTFQMTKGYALPTFWFDDPVSIQGIACVYLDTQANADYSMTHKLMNVRYIAEE